MAETYHVTDWRALPVRTAAALAGGLPEGSRIMRKRSGNRIGLETRLLAAILDDLNLLIWSRSKDAEHGRNRPQSVLKKLTESPKPVQVTGFRTPGDFETARAEIIRSAKHG